jgi:site-specific DNA-methyltransferase (adenine-specific)
MLELPQNIPHTQIGESTLINADCFDVFPHIKDQSVDAIICDLPYGMTAPDWDKDINMEKLWKEYNRIISKNGTIVLFATQPFTTKLISSNQKDFRYCWYWLKNQGTNFFHAKHMPIRQKRKI